MMTREKEPEGVTKQIDLRMRIAYQAMLSVPLLMITYNLIEHLANRRASAPHRDPEPAP